MELYLVVPFVSALITRESRGQCLVLVGEHPSAGSAPKPYPGFTDLIGGKIGPDETAEYALIREVWEETGFRVVECQPFATFHHTKGVIDRNCLSPLIRPGLGICYLVEVRGRLRPSELVNVRWINLNQALVLKLTPWARHYLARLFQEKLPL